MGLGIIRKKLSTYYVVDSREERGVCWRLLLFCTAISLQIQGGRSVQVELKNEDVCHWGTFQPNCSENEVIIVNSARYGRMKSGSCISIENGERPCFIDALPYVDSKCGGRRACELTIPIKDLDRMQSTCNSQRYSYLEISYHCQEVHTAVDEACIASQSPSVPPSSGYLANIVTDGTGKGSSLCPWRFQLQPEQTMNLTLLDFGIYGRNSNHVEDSRCLMYAVIKERLPSSSSSSSEWSSNLVCAGNVRTKSLLTLVTKEVQIEVKKLNGQQNDKVYFLIRFNVVGCPEFVAPDDSVVDKTSNGYRVTCKDSSLGAWNVNCVAGKWSTTTRTTNCTLLPQGSSPSFSNTFQLNQGLLIVIVLAVAIVISTVIIVIGILLLQKRKSYSPPESVVDSPVMDNYGNLLYYTPSMGKRCIVSAGQDRPMTDLEREYATTLQMRQMVPPLAVLHPDSVPPPGGEIWMCPVHGLRTPGTASRNGSLSRPNFIAYRPRMEHRCEPPEAICEAEVICPQSSGEMLTPEFPFYHELDPNHPQFPEFSRSISHDLKPSTSPPATPGT